MYLLKRNRLTDIKNRLVVAKGTRKDEMVGWYHNSMNMSLGKLQELVMNREG